MPERKIFEYNKTNIRPVSWPLRFYADEKLSSCAPNSEASYTNCNKHLGEGGVKVNHTTACSCLKNIFPVKYEGRTALV